MPKHGGKRVVLVKGAEAAMEAFKMEVAQDLGLLDKMGPDMSYRNLSTTEVGNIGGEMVRRIQAAGEFAVMQRYEQGQNRLMPEEVLPAPERVRNVSNNGNVVESSGTLKIQEESQGMMMNALPSQKGTNNPDKAFLQ